MARERRIGALLAPSGLYVAEYRVSRDGVELLGCTEGGRPPADAAGAVGRLADLARGDGRTRGRLSLALCGYGAVHQILSLPPAAPEILRPVVARELARHHPELGDAEAGYAWLDAEPDGGRGGRHLLGAAVPRAFVRTCAEALHARGVALEHLTVLPSVIQRLFDAYAGTPRPTAVLLLLRGMPILGFFHEGRLRFYREPPASGVHGVGAEQAHIIAEQVERGALFLRQQFRGAAVDRLLVAAEPEEQEEVEAALARELTLEIERFGPRAAPPGALVALGAALDSVDDAGIDLIPAELRPTRGVDRLARALGVASIALIALSAVWWSWAAARAAGEAEARVAALERVLEDEIEPLGAMRDVVLERRRHADRVAFLDALEEDRARLQRVLRAIALATPAAVRLDTVEARRGEAGSWTIELAGSARGATYADAALAFNRLYQALPRRLPLEADPVLELPAPPDVDSDGAAGTSPSVAMAFRMSFIVRSRGELGG